MVHHRINGVLEFEHLALHVDRDFLGQVAVGHRCRDHRDVAHLRGQVGGHEVHRFGEILPHASHPFAVGLATELAFGTDFASHTSHFTGERTQLIHHRIDGVLQFEHLTLHVDRDLLGQVAVGDCRRDHSDVAHLRGQVGGHEVHRFSEILPRASHPFAVGLTTQLALGTDFASHASHLTGERRQLIDHRVDCVLQFEHLALHVDGYLLGQVAVGHCRCDHGNVAYLRCQIRGHEVHRVGEIFPHPGYARHHRLPTEPAVGPDLTHHPRHLRGERAELIDHRVGGFFQLQNLAAHIDGDLLGEIASGHGDRDLCDVPDLSGQVTGHLVDRVGQIFPNARYALDLCLAAELALDADFAGHTSYFRREDRELLDHRIDQLRRAEEFPFEGVSIDFQLHRLSQVPLCHSTDGPRDFCCRPHEIVDQRIDRLHLHRPPANRPR